MGPGTAWLGNLRLTGAPEAPNATSHRTYVLCMPSVMFILFIISTHGTVTAALCVY